jgi:threonine synthase
VRARNLGKLLGIKELYIKNDTANPTWSFKDRVVSVALSRAVEFGFDTAACASTGQSGQQRGGARGARRHEMLRLHSRRP